MRCSKRGFLYCISFSLFFTVVNAASSAVPGPDGFPPFPPDQELQEEDFSAPEYDEPFKDDKPLEDENPENPVPLPPPLPRKDAEKVFYYRGNRTYSEELPLKVNFIRCMRDEDGNIVLMIFFNQSVNPGSVKHESFLINNNELPDDIRFSFNRKGDTIRVVIQEEQEEFLVKVQDVCAFNGVCIEPVELLAKVED